MMTEAPFIDLSKPAWVEFQLPEIYLSNIPEALWGLEWVRVLGYAVASDRDSAYWLGDSSDWTDFYRSSAPNGLSQCEFSQIEGWSSLDPETADEFGTEARQWAEMWVRRFEISTCSRVTQRYFSGMSRVAKFVRYVASTVSGWTLPIHHFEQNRIIQCPECDQLSDDWSETRDTERALCDGCMNEGCYWSFNDEAYYEYEENMPERQRRSYDSVGDHSIVGFNKNTSIRLGFSETGTYYGFELEVENEGEDSFSDALDLLDKDVWRAHEDGSLNNGIEVVSYPMSADYIRENLNLNWLRQWSSNGWRSWDADGETCGLHVHVSRAGFSSDVHLFAFAQLIYGNEYQMTTLAGRHSDYGSFNYGKRPPLALDVKKRARFSDRYVAVNLTNDHTAEVRIFRGSLKESRVRSALELVSGAVEFTRPLTIRDLNAGALKWTKFVEFLNQTPDYYSNLLELIESKGL